MKHDASSSCPISGCTSSATSPRSVNLIAFPTRLMMICRRRAGSPDHPFPGHPACIAAVEFQMPSACARNARVFNACSSTVVQLNSTDSSSSLPASILEKSRMSLMTVSRRVGRRLRRFRGTRAAPVSAGRVQGQFRHAHDSIHGRANFVAHVGQELALQPVGLFGSVLSLQARWLFPVAARESAAPRPASSRCCSFWMRATRQRQTRRRMVRTDMTRKPRAHQLSHQGGRMRKESTAGFALQTPSGLRAETSKV